MRPNKQLRVEERMDDNNVTMMVEATAVDLCAWCNGYVKRSDHNTGVKQAVIAPCQGLYKLFHESCEKFHFDSNHAQQGCQQFCNWCSEVIHPEEATVNYGDGKFEHLKCYNDKVKEGEYADSILR